MLSFAWLRLKSDPTFIPHKLPKTLISRNKNGTKVKSHVMCDSHHSTPEPVNAHCRTCLAAG